MNRLVCYEAKEIFFQDHYQTITTISHAECRRFLCIHMYSARTVVKLTDKARKRRLTYYTSKRYSRKGFTFIYCLQSFVVIFKLDEQTNSFYYSIFHSTATPRPQDISWHDPPLLNYPPTTPPYTHNILGCSSAPRGHSSGQ